MARSLAIPVLPCRSVEETLEFYTVLGFRAQVCGEGIESYIILSRADGIELHFFCVPALNPSASCSGCYVKVAAVDALRQEFGERGIPSEGMPRLTGVEDKPWGMREFALVDPSGNLLRIGQELNSNS